MPDPSSRTTMRTWSGSWLKLVVDPKVSTLRHGVESVHHQREDYLLDLGSVANDRRQIGIELRLHLNAREIELVLDQAQRSVDHLIQIGGL